jgi:flagellar capping protein FliD
MEHIDYKLKKSNTANIMHDSSRNVQDLMKVCNDLIDKVNELVDEVNELRALARKDEPQGE